MQNRSGVRRIATDRVSSLPWLPPPAGYIILIQDVAYGNRYKIARHQRLDRHLMRRGADFPFETRVAQILEADNAAQAERDLRDELAPGAPADEWFDLQRYPPAKPSPAPQSSMASLRDLALNDVDAESLLQGAKIVDASSQPANPQRPAAREGSAPDRRWLGAIALGLAVLAIVLAAGRSSDIQRVISSIAAELPGQSAPRPSAGSPTRVGASRTLPSSPTPTAASTDRLVATATSIRPSATSTATDPPPSATSTLNEPPPTAASTATDLPAPTATATVAPPVKYVVETRGNLNANIRSCPSTSCAVVANFAPGAEVDVLGSTTGETVFGTDVWLEIGLDGGSAFIHSELVAMAQ